jgi:hypothetical protein
MATNAEIIAISERTSGSRMKPLLNTSQLMVLVVGAERFDRAPKRWV